MLKTITSEIDRAYKAMPMLKPGYKEVSISQLVFIHSRLGEYKDKFKRETEGLACLMNALFQIHKPFWMFWITDDKYRKSIKIRNGHYLTDTAVLNKMFQK
jgi:hypothetical protein